MNLNITGYKVIHEGETAGSLDGLLYKYLFGANGVFLAADNEVFKTIIPISFIKNPTQYVRGLELIQPVIILPKRVPSNLLASMVFHSRLACPHEILFYLSYVLNEWVLITPEQKADRLSIQPTNSSFYFPIEVHSHNTMPAIFSGTDNADENGLRIYGVLGRVDQPVVDFRLRISIYGHWSVLPYQLVFEPTAEVKNA